MEAILLAFTRGKKYFVSLISNEIVIDINIMSCPIKVNSNTIELTVHTSCYCVVTGTPPITSGKIPKLHCYNLLHGSFLHCG